jgi:chemotaxis protein CheC
MLTSYSADQADALREVVNIGMGLAANSLALTLNTFVRLPVPAVRLIKFTDVVQTISELAVATTRVTAVRQAFTSSFHGEALVVFGPQSAEDLGSYLAYAEPLTPADREEILLEITNILVGACLGGIAQQLAYHLIFSAPSFMAENTSIEELLKPERMTWERSLLVEVNFRLEEKNFLCHILLFWPEDSIDAMANAIDRLMEGP